MKCIIIAVGVCYYLAVWSLEELYVDSLRPNQHFFSHVETFLGYSDSKQGAED